MSWRKTYCHLKRKGYPEIEREENVRGKNSGSKIRRLCPLAQFSICSHGPENITSKFLNSKAEKIRPKTSHFRKILTHEGKHAKTCPRSHDSLTRLKQAFWLSGSELRTHSFLPWNSTINTLKVSMKSKHTYIKNLMLFLTEPNRNTLLLKSFMREPEQ